MKYNQANSKNMWDSKQIKILKTGVFLLVVVLLTAVFILNRFITREVEDASRVFEQSTVDPAKLSISGASRTKAVPLDVLSPESQAVDVQTPIQPPEEKKKKEKVIYEMPVSEENLPQ